MNNYDVGDIVYVFDSRISGGGKSPKFKAEVYKGPFVVILKIK